MITMAHMFHSGKMGDEYACHKKSENKHTLANAITTNDIFDTVKKYNLEEVFEDCSCCYQILYGDGHLTYITPLSLAITFGRVNFVEDVVNRMIKSGRCFIKYNLGVEALQLNDGGNGFRIPNSDKQISYITLCKIFKSVNGEYVTNKILHLLNRVNIHNGRG